MTVKHKNNSYICFIYISFFFCFFFIGPTKIINVFRQKNQHLTYKNSRWREVERYKTFYHGENHYYKSLLPRKHLLNILPASCNGANLLIRSIFFGQTPQWFNKKRKEYLDNKKLIKNSKNKSNNSKEDEGIEDIISQQLQLPLKSSVDTESTQDALTPSLNNSNKDNDNDNNNNNNNILRRKKRKRKRSLSQMSSSTTSSNAIPSKKKLKILTLSNQTLSQHNATNIPISKEMKIKHVIPRLQIP